jgi:hypothetical protein
MTKWRTRFGFVVVLTMVVRGQFRFVFNYMIIMTITAGQDRNQQNVDCEY